MKVLVPVFPNINIGYPAKSFPGGTEVVIEKIVDSLVRLGHEVSLLTPRGFPVYSNKVNKICGNFKPAEERSHITDWKSYTLCLFNELEKGNHDVAIVNNLTLYMGNLWSNEEIRKEVTDRFKGLCPYIRAIYHQYDDYIAGPLYSRRQIQVLMEIINNGGRSFSVSSTLVDFMKRRFPENVLQYNIHNVDMLTHTIAPEKLEVFDNRVFVETRSEVSSDGSFLFVGRGSKDKNLVLAIESFLESNLDAKLKIYTTPPQHSVMRRKKYEGGDGVYFENAVEKYQKEPKLEWNISAPREKVLKAFSESSVLLFPSKRESFGLVPFEAACQGMSLIYHNTNAQCYEPSDIYCQKCDKASFVDAIKRVDIPNVFQKQNRVEHMRNTYTQEKFDQQIQNLLQPA